TESAYRYIRRLVPGLLKRGLIRSTLCTTMLENFLHLRKSRGRGCEFLGACVTRGQQRRDGVPTFFSNDVPVRRGHFCDQAMRPQQPQAPSHCRHLFVLLLFVLGRRVEMRTQITIAKTVE